MPPALNTVGLLRPDAVLLPRKASPQTDGKDYQPGVGVTDPHNFNNIAFFVLFGIIGAAVIIGGIWFFFWARNGGFYFKESDWEDYKSTVLRRKGPNGTTLSGATESTVLGGGSVYKDVADHDQDEDGTVFTEGTALSGITGGVSDFSGRERRKALRQKKIKKMQEKDRAKKEEKRARKEEQKREKENGEKTRRVGRDGAVVDEGAEEDAEDELRRYRHERPARVGGLNAESEGSNWDGSTNPSDSTVSASLLDNQQATPTNSPTKSAGIRKVYSTADRNDQRERERLRAEARAESRRRRESRGTEGRSRTSRDDRPRREFSYSRAVDSANAESAITRGNRAPRTELSAVTESTEDTEQSERRERRERRRRSRSRSQGVPGGWGSEATESDLGTRSYHHPIPELRSQEDAAPRSRDERQRERRRRERERGGGYRRARQDDFEE